jgi:hypothetical protein
LIRAQIAKAKGISHLVIRDKTTGKFVRVTDPNRIMRVINGGKNAQEVWEIWTRDPDTGAFTAGSGSGRKTDAARRSGRAAQPIPGSRKAAPKPPAKPKRKKRPPMTPGPGRAGGASSQLPRQAR